MQKSSIENNWEKIESLAFAKQNKVKRTPYVSRNRPQVIELSKSAQNLMDKQREEIRENRLRRAVASIKRSCINPKIVVEGSEIHFQTRNEKGHWTPRETVKVG